jgi:hypothetical protein
MIRFVLTVVAVFAVLLGGTTQPAQAGLLGYTFNGPGISGGFVYDTANLIGPGGDGLFTMRESRVVTGSFTAAGYTFNNVSNVSNTQNVNSRNQFVNGTFALLNTPPTQSLGIFTNAMTNQQWQAITPSGTILGSGTGNWTVSPVILPNSISGDIWDFIFLALLFLEFVDPPVATGYAFSVDPGGPLFTSVTIPTTVAGHPLTSNLDVSFGGTNSQVAPGYTYSFPQPVPSFSVTGIPQSFAVDPTNDEAFVAGLTFNQTGTAHMQIIPLTSPTASAIPEPSTFTLFGLGAVCLGVCGWRRRKRGAA